MFARQVPIALVKVYNANMTIIRVNEEIMLYECSNIYSSMNSLESCLFCYRPFSKIYNLGLDKYLFKEGQRYSFTMYIIV